MTKQHKTSRKMTRMADRIFHESMKNRNYSQAAKSMGIKLKINQEDSLLKTKVDELSKINITDLPIEILIKWQGELAEKLLQYPEYREIILNLPKLPDDLMSVVTAPT